MSTATGIAGLMVGAGWWAGTEDPAEAENVVMQVERTEPDEIAISIRSIETDNNPGTIYITPEMAEELRELLRREINAKVDDDAA